MSDSSKKQRNTLQRLARWHHSYSGPLPSTKSSSTTDKSLQCVDHNDLIQGEVYIIKIKKVSVALFDGWDDDMCCFSVLRSDASPMRWCDARYMPGDFDAYDAFDDAGNPPVHLWSRYLHVSVPVNWFTMFEEARRRQREWRSVHGESYDTLSAVPRKSDHNSQSQTVIPPVHQLHNFLDQSVHSYAPPSSSPLPVDSVPSVASPTHIAHPDYKAEQQSSVSSLRLDTQPLGVSDFFDQRYSNGTSGQSPIHSATGVQTSIRSQSPTSTTSYGHTSVLDPASLRKQLAQDLRAESQ